MFLVISLCVFLAQNYNLIIKVKQEKHPFFTLKIIVKILWNHYVASLAILLASQLT